MNLETDRMKTKDTSSHDRLELRSEKVRHLLEEIPSPIVRYGTIIIAAIFLLAAIVLLYLYHTDNEPTSMLEYILSGIMP